MSAVTSSDADTVTDKLTKISVNETISTEPTKLVIDEKILLAGIDTSGMSELARSAFEDDSNLPPAITCIPLTPSSKSTQNIEKLRELLNRKLHVEVSDGRKFTGTACCFDDQRNIILSQCIEHRSTKVSDGMVCTSSNLI